MRMLKRYESFCCYLTTLFPKVLTVGLYMYGIYAYSFIVCFEIIGGISGLVLSLIGMLLAIQGIYTYLKVIKVGPGSPLDFTELRIDDDLENSRLDPPEFLISNSVQVKGNGNFRSCNKCHVWKPDRSHHCSNCDRCQLRMDHHCPWFATCIGFKNHKYFIQFLLITVLYTILILIVSAYQIYRFFHTEEYRKEFLNMNLLTLAILSLCLSIAVSVFTGMTLYFIFKNLTTIEYYDYSRYRNNLEIVNDSYYKYSNKPSTKDYGNLYDLGWKRNWQLVMGSNWREWIFPIANSNIYNDYYQNNGLFYESDPYLFQKLKSNSDIQNRLLNELRGMRQG